ncbi:hypothetical protein SAMN06295987_10343 [Novosphingobium mathurense]|uniref:Uncharacterized protein n=1 Tax=Novosphingobium mathurense TaxID=428990 RepID=A0A1U6HTT5_9SPHN|nr:hypothetical protein SAMN06295987_10343 [Novosphingobium mathurense]
MLHGIVLVWQTLRRLVLMTGKPDISIVLGVSIVSVPSATRSIIPVLSLILLDA